jgi:hypothetical protein
MKKYAFILAILYTAALLACKIPPSGTFKYFTYNGTETIIITGYTGPGGIVSIPAVIKGKPVITIGDNVFENKGLTNITIPASVIEIVAK